MFWPGDESSFFFIAYAIAGHHITAMARREIFSCHLRKPSCSSFEIDDHYRRGWTR